VVDEGVLFLRFRNESFLVGEFRRTKPESRLMNDVSGGDEGSGSVVLNDMKILTKKDYS